MAKLRPSVPDRFLRHVEPLLPEGDLAELAAACARPLAPTVRANPLRLDRAALEAALTGMGWSPEPLPFTADGFRVTGVKAPGNSLEHAVGLFYLQEAASMLPVEALFHAAPAPRRILDLCAAPGSKTTQLAGRVGPDALILANEPATNRFKTLVANLIRCGATNTVVAQRDGRNIGARLPAAFDAVLVDAPCSGEGTIRTDRKALSRWHPKRLRGLANAQRALLDAGCAALAPGGTLVYSTCAISPEENHHVCREFLSRHDEMEIVDLGDVIPRSRTAEGWLWVLPHHLDTGGFFVAAFKKLGEAPVRPLDEARSLRDDDRVTDEQRQGAEQVLARYGLTLDGLDGTLVRRGETLVLASEDGLAWERHFGLNRVGPRLVRLIGEAVRPHHDLALLFGPRFTRGFLDVERADACRIVIGLEIEDPRPAPEPDEVLIRWGGHPVGFATPRGGRLASAIPPGFSRPNCV